MYKNTLNRRKFLKCVLLGGSAVALSSRLQAVESPATDKPNFIFILSDDQGYQDLGCRGAIGFGTPNIDQMAKEGVCFTSFYVAPYCSPTRAMLMTGRYPIRMGIGGPINNPTYGLPPSEITIAELLKDEGYATALIGKWHLGLPKSMSPIAQGFDYFSGIPLSQIRRGKTEHDRYYRRQWRVMTTEGRDDVEYDPDDTQFTQRCTKEALKYIREHKDEPFFLYLAHPMAHREVVASEAFFGKTERGIYGDACQELDWSVSEILGLLKELDLDKKTLLVYASDNGGPRWRNIEVCPEDRLACNLPLRGWKGQTLEGGCRVPCIVRWPGRIPAGRVSDEIVSIIDFYPTFASICGTKVPTDRPIDGVNIWPLLSGATDKSPRDTYIYCNHNQVEGLRKGKWKLRAPQKRGKSKVEIETKPSLYDLQADIGETKDLAAQHPEIVERLMDELKKARAEIR